MSAQLQIQGALIAALRASPKLAYVPIRANHLDPLPQDTRAHVVIRTLGSSAAKQQSLGAPYDWSTQFAIECAARADRDQDPLAAVDPLLMAAWEAVANLAASTVGVGAIGLQIDPLIKWEVQRADTYVAAAILAVIVLHRTQPLSLDY